jgi:ABC-type sulfate transport system substrate-binding protein
MPQGESDREKLERLAKENLAKRVTAEDQKKEAEAKARQDQVNLNAVDQQKTKEIFDLFKPIFEGFILPETGQTVSVRMDTSVSTLFLNMPMDNLPNVSINMSQKAQFVTLFIARCRNEKYWMAKITESGKAFASLEAMKEYALTDIASLDRQQVSAILRRAGISDV